MREVRRAAIQAQKNCKETLPRARRLTKEMMLYWKKYDKVEKEHRKRAEKEALEQRKLDEEMREVPLGLEALSFLSYLLKKKNISMTIWCAKIVFSLSGQAAAAQTEFPHHSDRVICPLHEWKGQHGWARWRRSSGGDSEKTRRQRRTETDRHWRRCHGQHRARRLWYD